MIQSQHTKDANILVFASNCPEVEAGSSPEILLNPYV